MSFPRQVRADRFFSINSAKAAKAGAFGYLNAILYLAPHTLAGVGNLCPKASAGCMALCLGHYSGHAALVADLERGDNDTRAMRRLRAQRFMKDRVAFMADVVHSIERLQHRAAKAGQKICVRMNGSTDIAWEGIKCERMVAELDAKGKYTVFKRIQFPSVYHAFPEIEFVDYTKIASRFARVLPNNLHLTFSRSETNEKEAIAVLNRGRNVAVVFGTKQFPKAWNGYRVIDGDKSDLRQLDPRAKIGMPGYVVGLSPKGGKAKRDTSGFVVR